jgi:hypothetical protein
MHSIMYHTLYSQKLYVYTFIKKKKTQKICNMYNTFKLHNALMIIIIYMYKKAAFTSYLNNLDYKWLELFQYILFNKCDFLFKYSFFSYLWQAKIMRNIVQRLRWNVNMITIKLTHVYTKLLLKPFNKLRVFYFFRKPCLAVEEIFHSRPKFYQIPYSSKSHTSVKFCMKQNSVL